MNQNLFRAEALKAKSAQHYGEILLAQPPKLWIMTLVSTLTATAIVIFLLVGTYTKRSTVSGVLVSSEGVATVLAPVTGVISKLSLEDGAFVSKGQSLAVIDIPRGTASGVDAQTSLQERILRRRVSLADEGDAQLALLSTQRAAVEDQLSITRRELKQINAELEVRRKQVQVTEKILSRYHQLQGDRYVSELQASQQELSLLTAQADLHELERSAEAAQRSIVLLEQQLDELPNRVRAIEAEREGRLATLEQEEIETQARGQLVITSPVTGIITDQGVQAGKAVQATQPLLSILPEGGYLEAELIVPSSAVGFIDPGDTVLLRYETYPHQKFGHHEGRVLRVSRSPMAGTTADGVPPSSYRIRVSLNQQHVLAYGKQEPLMPGMRLEADILGDTRSLAEWLLEPLYSLKGKVGGN